MLNIPLAEYACSNNTLVVKISCNCSFVQFYVCSLFLLYPNALKYDFLLYQFTPCIITSLKVFQNLRSFPGLDPTGFIVSATSRLRFMVFLKIFNFHPCKYLYICSCDLVLSLMKFFNVLSNTKWLFYAHYKVTLW